MSEPTKLATIAELGETAVTTIETRHGRLAVGLSGGEPFAVSDRCRHLGASLGKGRVAEDGCLECPWHRARYDITSGAMIRGPQGAAWLPVREAVRLFTNAFARLKRYPVSERDGDIFLDEP
jgi:3-phenylpropionate/trans-cinnamate dioxygenase ferredoxin component